MLAQFDKAYELAKHEHQWKTKDSSKSNNSSSSIEGGGHPKN